MAVKIKGKTYYYVDTQVKDGFVIDIYEDENGHIYTKVIDYID